MRDEVLDVYKRSLKKVETSFGVEIDEKSIRLVKLELKEGKISKLNFDSENLSEIGGKDLSKPVESLLKRNKYRGEEIYLHFSFGFNVLNKVIQVELKTGERLEQWILANKETVFPPLTEDDIYYDYFVLENGQSERQLCLSLAHKEKLDSILKIAEKHHLNLKRITAGSLTLHDWLKVNGHITDEELIIVILKDASAEVLFYDKGIPIFVSEIPVDLGLDDFCSSFNELSKLHHGEGISYCDKKVLLLGQPIVTERLKAKLNEKRFKSVSRDVVLNSKGMKNSSIPPEFINLFALVSQSLSRATSNINLLPQNKRKNDLLFKRINKIFNFSFRFALISLAILIVLNLGLGFYLNQNQDKLNLFESKMNLVNELRKENQVLIERNRTISNLLVSQSEKAQLLFVLSQLLPQRIWLRSLSNESEGENSENRANEINLSGLSLSESDVSQLVANLEQSKFFKEISVAYLDRVSYQDTRGVSGKYRNTLFKFKIEMRSEI